MNARRRLTHDRALRFFVVRHAKYGTRYGVLRWIQIQKCSGCETGASKMRKRTDRHNLRLWMGKALALIVLSAALFAGLLFSPLNCFADDGPKADPAGTSTGDRNAAVDAAGNAFVVAEPTDKTAPDYAAQKKAYEEQIAWVMFA
jgi:hypothetical protein